MAENKGGEKKGDVIGGDSRLGASTPLEFAGYVFDHVKVFRQIAESKNLVFLSYLLEVASLEAARVRDNKNRH